MAKRFLIDAHLGIFHLEDVSNMLIDTFVLAIARLSILPANLLVAPALCRSLISNNPYKHHGRHCKESNLVQSISSLHYCYYTISRTTLPLYHSTIVPSYSTNITMFLRFLMLCVVPAYTALAFSIRPTSYHSLGHGAMSLKASLSLDTANSSQENAISCFITNAFEVEQEGATPHVVCTSEPEEYAWMEGIDLVTLKPTDGIVEGALECVEGASPRGTPQYECRVVTKQEECTAWM
eukprot:scaffold3901_cov174-Amphora_coffeaeformis.AAC.7